MSGELICFFLGCFVGAGLVVVGTLFGEWQTRKIKRLYPNGGGYQPSGPPRPRPPAPPPKWD